MPSWLGGVGGMYPFIKQMRHIPEVIIVEKNIIVLIYPEASLEVREISIMAFSQKEGRNKCIYKERFSGPNRKVKINRLINTTSFHLFIPVGNRE